MPHERQLGLPAANAIQSPLRRALSISSLLQQSSKRFKRSEMLQMIQLPTFQSGLCHPLKMTPARSQMSVTEYRGGLNKLDDPFLLNVVRSNQACRFNPEIFHDPHSLAGNTCRGLARSFQGSDLRQTQ